MQIGTAELSERSGASRRQIDYWTVTEVIPCIGEINPGAGSQRKFDESIVDAVTVLARVSKALNHHVHGDVLKKIYDCYEEGLINLGEGLILTWRY